ncbi:hypothetical protein P885DRAFT_46258 [Corynascus similis CBS 632.67]
MGSEVRVLQPVPRREWDSAVRVREATLPANVTLSDSGEMLWRGHGENATSVVSFKMWTGKDRKVADMGQWADELGNVVCAEAMSFEFLRDVTYQSVKQNWEWVNFNGMRTFVLIPDHKVCNLKGMPVEPWIISNVVFEDATRTVRMDAVQKKWGQIVHTYQLDFGELGMAGSQPLQKRGWLDDALDFDYDKAFTLDLSSRFPEKIFSAKWDTPSWGSVSMNVTCPGCGTTGQLVFAGHIEGSVLDGVDSLYVSATPRNLGAELNVEMTLSGKADLSKTEFGSNEWELLTIPLPAGWSIPGILTFGPNAKVLAGYKLGVVEGTATLGTGVAIMVPDDSLAKVDVLAEDSLDFHGWVPTVQTRPLTLEAEISASAQLYTKVTVGVGLEVLDDNGINVDVGLKLPIIDIDVTAGYNPEGFCPDNLDPFGVELDVSLGAALDIKGWDEIDGKRNELFSATLFSADDLYEFPSLCLHSGDAPANSCAAQPYPEELDWWFIEVVGYDDLDDDDDDGEWLYRRDESHLLEARGTSRKYKLDCDPQGSWPLRIKAYHSPKYLVNKGIAGTPDMPIMLPGILTCDPDHSNPLCLPNQWTVESSTEVAAVYNWDRWAAEHAYEGVWIKDFLDHLYETYYSTAGLSCEQMAKNTFNLGSTTGYAADLATAVGNKANYMDTMVLFPQKENTIKNRMFEPKISNIYKVLDTSSSHHERACAIGRIVNTCKYMEHDEVQKRMKWTISKMDAVLDRMDQAAKAGTLTPPPPASLIAAGGFRKAHEHFFTEKFNNGTDKTRNYLQNKAGNIVLTDLHADLQSALGDIAQGKLDDYCKEGYFTYPAFP